MFHNLFFFPGKESSQLSKPPPYTMNVGVQWQPSPCIMEAWNLCRSNSPGLGAGSKCMRCPQENFSVCAEVWKKNNIQANTRYMRFGMTACSLVFLVIVSKSLSMGQLWPPLQWEYKREARSYNYTMLSGEAKQWRRSFISQGVNEGRKKTVIMMKR